MKRIFRIALISASLGVLITICTGFIKRDYSYDVSICTKDNSSFLFPTKLGSVTVHYNSVGFPWTYKDYAPENPVSPTCPEPNLVSPSWPSLNKVAFIYDFFAWTVLFFAVIYIIDSRKQKGSKKKR
jgi:hypothetical protein